MPLFSQNRTDCFGYRKSFRGSYFASFVSRRCIFVNHLYLATNLLCYGKKMYFVYAQSLLMTWSDCLGYRKSFRGKKIASFVARRCILYTRNHYWWRGPSPQWRCNTSNNALREIILQEKQSSSTNTTNTFGKLKKTYIETNTNSK